MRIPHRYSLSYNASDDTHWGAQDTSTRDIRTGSAAYLENPEQLPNVQALMSVAGFKACYLVNCEHLTHSTILGHRSYVTGAQLALISASIQIGIFEQLALSLTHADLFVRYTPNLPDYACVLIVDKEEGDSTSAMNALKDFCKGLT